MGVKRISGGSFDFIDDPDEEEKKMLEMKLGKRAKIGGSIQIGKGENHGFWNFFDRGTEFQGEPAPKKESFRRKKSDTSISSWAQRNIGWLFIIALVIGFFLVTFIISFLQIF